MIFLSISHNFSFDCREVLRHEQEAREGGVGDLQEVSHPHGPSRRVPEGGRERRHRQGRDPRPHQGALLAPRRPRAAPRAAGGQEGTDRRQVHHLSLSQLNYSLIIIFLEI